MKWLLLSILSGAAWAQSFSQRGYIETELVGFPQLTTNDKAHVVGEAILRWDVAYKIAPWLTFSGGVEAQTDTHHQTERKFHLDVQDRGLLRPAFEVRSFAFTIHKDFFTADIGKQFIRWGKADILNPTDRFAPRDYLSVVDNEFLGVLATRARMEHAGTSIDLVWTPRFTPSRTPLLGQRWTVLPDNLPGLVENAATHFPGAGQYGTRVNHVGKLFEASASWFEGYNHLPLITGTFYPYSDIIAIERFYPKIRMYGTDSAIPLPWFTVKTEAAYIQSAARPKQPAPRSDDYILYVAQLERQVGEWTFVGGYAGQTITKRRNLVDFDPERGLTRAFLGRAAYNIDARQNVLVETALRQNGDGAWTRAEYSRMVGDHWRATVDVAVIGGERADFLGQYHRNSHAILKVRYSF